MTLPSGSTLWRRLFPGGITRIVLMSSGLGLVGVMMAVVTIGYNVWSERQHAIALWERWSIGQSGVIAEQTFQAFKATDLTLTTIVDLLDQQDPKTDADLRAVATTDGMQQNLNNLATALPQVFALTIIAKDGTTLAASRIGAINFDRGKVNLADREYFSAQVKNPNIDLYISQPVVGRFSNAEKVIFLSKKVKSRSGDLIGVVSLGLRPAYFSQLYGSFIGTDSSKSLILLNRDGTVLARFPPRESQVGAVLPFVRDLAGHPERAADRPQRQSDATLLHFQPGANIFEPGLAQSTIGAIEFTRQYPLVSYVGVSESEYLADWWDDLPRNIATLLIDELLVLALTVALCSIVSHMEVARLQAEAGEKAKSEFLAMMSHEIRTPINAIVGMSDALLEARLADREHAMARIVNNASMHLLTIINTILDFSRLEAGFEHFVPSPFELRGTIRTVMGIASSLSGAHNLDLTSHVDPDVPDFIIGDQGHITQVLLNLIGNAVKFTKAGSVELMVGRLRNQSDDGQIWLRFSVADTGLGISDEQAERLFKPFERGGPWRENRQSGTGLGLAICKRLVDLMHGRIGAIGAPGAGSVFWFELPVQLAVAPPEQSGTKPAGPTAIPGAPHPIHILVAEDSETSQIVARNLLESLGHTVTIAETGREALEMVQREAFDLVLMDGHMPEMNGLDATRAIRALGGRFAKLPIFGLSANVLNTDRDLASAAGMDGYLTKPVRKPDLAALIAGLFASRGDESSTPSG